MTYKAEVAVCSEIRIQNTQHNVSTMSNFLILNLVVRKEAARL
jgi:hypothetical protein